MRAGFRHSPIAFRLLPLAFCLLPVAFCLPAALAAEPRFVESSEALGVRFVHRHHGTGQKFMIENMAPGVAVFDANGDGRLDLFFVQGAPVPGSTEPAETHRLFLQREDGTFEDASARAGFGSSYGMGVAVGDYDADGHPDLYVTSFGPDTLYRNRGDGTFEDVTAQAGLGDPLWGVSAGFFDADGDGDLDLYVVRYVDFSYENHKWCGDAARQIRAYCHPDVYEAVPDLLYRNDGEGRFTEVSRTAGVPATRDAKGLGLTFADLDDDGRTDVYVANDSTMNFLLLSQGSGRFVESALLAGVGFNGSGAAEAGMGTFAADLDGDGRLDLFVTHLDEETNTLYRNEGGGLFSDATEAAGLGTPSRPMVGFGTVAFDHDNDGDLDVFVTNGHIIDNVELFYPERRHRQPAQLFDNQGAGRFVDLSSALGLAGPLVGRGAATGDLDGDGDLDLIVTQNGAAALVLLNRTESGARSLVVRLRGAGANLEALGARLTLTAGGRRQVREIAGAQSYLSQSSRDVHFGLGSVRQADELLVRWPSGRTDRFSKLVPGHLYTLTEGSTEVKAEPFRAARP
jgi:enediyne biosynthesis protein E4